ncbi:helix-turn-helix domain-containing protein [Nostoc sp.]
MLLGFRIKLNFNNKQKTMLANSGGVARFAYN